MPATRPSAALGVRSSSSRATSRSRPVKLAVSRGRVLEAAAAAAPGATSCTAASTSAAGPRPRAAATNSARTGPARPSASASSPAVSLWAVRWIPRSRSLTDRGERPAASASSSWVSFASVRNCRSNPANPGPGCSATAPRLSKTPPATTGPPRAGPAPKAYADPITAATRQHRPASPAGGTLLRWDLARSCPGHLIPRHPIHAWRRRRGVQAASPVHVGHCVGRRVW